MPRSPRRVIPDCPHHLVLRGNNRRRIFSYEYDRVRFVNLLAQAQAQSQTRVRVHAMCLLSNHVHLLATPEHSVDLGRFVKSFAQRYAQYRNRRRQSTGKLFEQRYWSRATETPGYLAIATAYVDDNAREAGRADLSQRWSTTGIHTGHGGTHPLLHNIWSPSPWYESLGVDQRSRRAAYKDWLRSCRAHRDWLKYGVGLPTQPQVGRDRRPNTSRAA